MEVMDEEVGTYPGVRLTDPIGGSAGFFDSIVQLSRA